MTDYKVTRIFDLLERMQKMYPKDDILACKRDEKWQKISTDEYARISHDLACGFLQMGLQAQDKMLTITPNCPEWNFIDMGLALAGMVHVPIYNTLSADDYRYIILHSDAKAVFVGSKSAYKFVAPIIKSVENPPRIITLEVIPGEQTLAALVESGHANAARWKGLIEDNKKNLSPSQVVTIIYTSGTTGTPKGVMLTHGNLIFNFTGHAVQQIKNHTHRMLSFLPLCHIYERSMNYEFQYLGISIYYAEGLNTIARDLKDIHGDGFCAVPRVMEMFYNKLKEAGKNLKGLKKVIYNWAFDFGCSFDYDRLTPWTRFRLNLADKLVYRKWRENLGGHEMLIVSGGSSIRARVIRLFSAARMYIYEGYGLTETSPVIAVNNPREKIRKIGTVGKIMEGVEVKFLEDGEILTRGPHIMAGYYKNPEATREVIDAEGWFHTGDVGEITEGVFLKITDRKKEIFKLSNGKYIAPQVIETKLNESDYIDSSFVVGSNRKTAAAIIVPNRIALCRWAAKHLPDKPDYAALLLDNSINDLIRREIEKINKTLAPHEQIKKFRLSAEEWTQQNGLLSQTLKLKRSPLTKHYESLINSMYRQTDG